MIVVKGLEWKLHTMPKARGLIDQGNEVLLKAGNNFRTRSVECLYRVAGHDTGPSSISVS